jgi:Lon protease-like protein
VAGGGASELPIFELPVVLLPGELLPLHIFEERYKRMLGHCLDSGEPFGIVFSDEEGGARNVGCTAEVAEVLEHFEDGRMNVVVSGGNPFRVLDRFEGSDFPAGDVELIDEESEPSERDEAAAELARRTFRELASQAGAEPPDIEELADHDAYALAARITLPAETKQVLLETRSEADRMRTLGRALRAVARAVRRQRRIAERARSNGHVKLG